MTTTQQAELIDALRREIVLAICGQDHLACGYPTCGCKATPNRAEAALVIFERSLAAALQSAEAEIEGMKDALVLIRDRAVKSRADWDDGAVIHFIAFCALKDVSSSTPRLTEAEVEKRGIYVASRASVLDRRAVWRRVRADGAPIISTWIDEDGPNDTADLGELWVRIRREVTTAAALILYVEPDDFPLKGAFVEVGMALAAEVPIYIVAPDVTISGRNQRPFGSWIKHPGVAMCETIESALDAIRLAAGKGLGG